MGKSNINWGTWIAAVCVSMVLSILANLGLSYVLIKKYVPTAQEVTTEEAPAMEVTDEDTGEVKTYVAGGEAVIKTASGETIPVKVAEDQYLISEDYLSILAKGFGTTKKIVANNLVITGDKPSVTQSMTSINAATFSDIFEIYCQIYGEEFRQEGVEGIWSPAYTLMKTGELPAELPDDYSAEEYGEVVYEGIRWKFYEVIYSTDNTVYADANGNPLPEEEVVPNIMRTQFLVAYSDTEDPVEIMCYEENCNTETQYKMICDFLQVKP